MNAETLSIKMKLDIGDVLSDVKKIKTQLSGMANTVKQSIPKIGTESTKAKSALSGITKASKDVKKSIEGIGDEAKESLSTVSKQSDKVAQALNRIGIAGKSAQSGLSADGITESADSANGSLEEMQGTMQAIVGMDFFGLLISNWDKITSNIKASTASMVQGFKKIGRAVTDAIGDFELVGKIDKQSLKFMAQDAASIGKSFAAAGKAALKAVGPILALAAAVTAVALAVNTLSVAKLGTEIYNGAQRVGMSAQMYQEWTYVLERAGIEAEELVEINKTLAEAQIDVIKGEKEFVDAFKQLGMTQQEVASLNQGELWNKTIAALQNVEDVTQRNIIAQRIFSEDMSKLTPLLNLTNQETKGLIDTYNRLGGAMSKELITNSAVLQGSLANLKVAWQGLKNTLAQAVIPAVITLVNWLTKAIIVVNVFLQKFFGLDLTPATTNINKGSDAIGGYTGALNSATAAAEKLKRSTMGFDELNVVPNPATASGGGGGGGVDTGTSFNPNFGNMSSIFTEASKQAEEFEKQVMEFMDKWGWAIKGIGIALAALSIRNLIVQLGTAIGLGETLSAALSFKGIWAGLTKLVGWFGAFFALLKEGNSLTSVLGAAFPKIAAALTKVGGVLKTIGGFLSKFGGWVALIVTAVVAAITFIIEKWDELKAATVSFFNEEVAPKFERIKDAALKLWDALKYLLQPIFDLIQGFREWWEASQPLKVLGEMITALGGVIVTILGSVVMGVINGLISAVTGVVEIVSGAIELITGIIKGFVNLVCALFTGDWSGMIEAWENIKSGVTSILLGLYDATIGVVVELVDGVITWFTELWDELVGHSIVPDMVDAIIEWFKKLPSEIFKMITNFVKTIINKFIELATNAGKWAVEMWTKVKKPFEGVASWFKNIFQSAWNGITSIWSKVGSFFTGVWNTIKGIFSKVGTSIAQGITGAVKGAINSVLSSVVNKINTFIGWINSAIGVINNIPGVSIGKISKLQVPQLATGGIVTSETLARIGERGKREAVLPLEQNTGWMDMLADRINARGGTDRPIHIHVDVDGTELGWAVIRSINNITKQTGGLQLAL